MERLLTTKEAAKYFGVSINQVRRYVAAGLKCFALGKGFKFDPADLSAWKERHAKIVIRYSRRRAS